MVIRTFEKEEQEEIFRITQEGGVLFLIERIDTNEFCTTEPYVGITPHEPLPKTKWDARIGYFIGTEMFLTKEDAKKHNKGFREGGCECCGDGSKEIKTKVTEHEFIN